MRFAFDHFQQAGLLRRRAGKSAISAATICQSLTSATVSSNSLPASSVADSHERIVDAVDQRNARPAAAQMARSATT